MTNGEDSAAGCRPGRRSLPRFVLYRADGLIMPNLATTGGPVMDDTVLQVLTNYGGFSGDPRERVEAAMSLIEWQWQLEQTGATDLRLEDAQARLASLRIDPPGESPAEKGRKLLMELIGENTVEIDLSGLDDDVHEWEMKASVLTHSPACECMTEEN